MVKEETKFSASDIFEGMTSVRAILAAQENAVYDRKIIKIFFDKEKTETKKSEYAFLKAKAKQYGFEIELTDTETIGKYTVGNTHGGIIAFCSPRKLPLLKDSDIKKGGIYYMLDGIEDPYNFGYSIRSIYASGADGIVLNSRNWMGSAGVVARSSAGTSELIDMFVSEPEKAVDFFKQRKYKVICAGIRDSESLFDAELKKPLLVIIGGEKRGISRILLEQADKIIRIDYGTDFRGSLSSAAATAVMAFEILRKNK